jgi:undecaprenol kinase
MGAGAIPVGGHQEMKNKPFLSRFGFAIAGLREVWRREKSFRTQAVLGALAIVGLVVLRPGFVWVAFVTICIVLIFALELINSAIEYLIDHLHPEVAPEIRLAKDAAAAAVLVASIGAIVVAVLLLAAWALG